SIIHLNDNRTFCFQPHTYYGLEYKYIIEHITGKLSYADMVAKLNVAIHQFAKRQMTWFRHVERHGARIHWIDGLLPLAEKLEQIESLLAAEKG
ncbi:MAG: hypothetical protein LBJ57_04760, partial [Prevotellaceae bacterium]|nr:hypothetical protein [Prevotellaceae bacterium]